MAQARPVGTRNPGFSLARNYPQLQQSTADPATQQAIQGAYQALYDLRDAIQYPSVATWRTLLLKNTNIGVDIADNVVMHGGGTIALVAGVLRKTIVSALTVQLNVVTATSSDSLGQFTIPANQPINTPIAFKNFSTAPLQDLSVLSWDVIASDGSSDVDGIASFSVYWM